MATKKKLLEAAAGAAGGAGGLNVEQLFSTYLYEGNGGSQVIENGINLGQSGDGGSAKFNNANTIDVADSTDFAFGGGDWTVEAFAYPLTNDDFVVAGWGEDSSNRFDFGWQQSTFPRIRIGENGVQYEANASTSYDISNYLGTWVHLAAVRNGNTVTLYLNGTSVASVSYSEAGFPTPSTAGIGIGSRWYTTRTSLTNPANGYISNFRIVKGTAVYTSNFTVPTSALTAITNTSLLCLQGDSPLSDNSGNSHSLTQNQYNSADVTASTFGPFDAAEAGEGGLVWIKDRDSSSNSHFLYDTERGVGTAIKTDGTNAAQTRSTGLTAFNSNGFTLGSLNAENSFGNSKASWTWRKAPNYFDVVTYTGTGSAQNISHNLGTTVGTLIVKRTDSTGDWLVQHRSLGGTYYMDLQNQNAAATNTTYWNNTTATSTEFTVGTSSYTNASGGTYVAYLFAHNDGDGEFGSEADQDIIKCGSFTTDASADATINLGWEPQWVLFRPYDDTSSWKIVDNMRGFLATATASTGYNRELNPNTSGAELNNDGIQITSTGFDHVSGFASKNFIYIAIRRGPMAVPTDATDVFSVTETSAASNAEITIGFPTDFHIANFTSGDTSNSSVYDRLRGFKTSATNGTGLLTSSTAAENTSYNIMYAPNMTGYKQGNYYANANSVRWDWKRAPNYFDVVAYTGNGTAGRTVSHNLGVAPEMMWVKSRTSGATTPEWSVYHKDLGNDKRLVLNTTAAVSGSSATFWYSTTPTETDFYTGSTYVNQSGYDYIAYLFASLDGVSKVGSFTYTQGVAQNIDCGFSSGARFVLYKRTSGTSGWTVFDTERGIVAGNDPMLFLNTTSAEDSNYDFIDPYSGGFALSDSTANLSGDYIFYAIA